MFLEKQPENSVNIIRKWTNKIDKSVKGRESHWLISKQNEVIQVLSNKTNAKTSYHFC